MAARSRKTGERVNIIVTSKVVPDDQDVQAGPDGSLDISKAKPVVSSFDLSALEAAAQLVESRSGDKLVALTAGTAYIDDSKLKKNILARGPEELICVIDEALADADTLVIAQTLAAALNRLSRYDLVICGDGSADIYAQQVGIQLGELLQVTVTNAVSKIELKDTSVVVERTLEAVKETVELPLPAVICVSSDIATPRICAMKEILAAGKKPVQTWALADLGISTAASIEVAETYVPKPVNRKNQIFDAAVDGDVDKFIAAVAAELR